VKISVLCVISAFERSLMQAYTRKPCYGRETARCRCTEIYSGIAVLPAIARHPVLNSLDPIMHLRILRNMELQQSINFQWTMKVAMTLT